MPSVTGIARVYEHAFRTDRDSLAIGDLPLCEGFHALDAVDPKLLPTPDLMGSPGHSAE
jgi:hypothetical protein